MKKILMASDLSARSDRALQRAVSLAQDFKAELEVVVVVDDWMSDVLVAQHEEQAKDTLQKQVASLNIAATTGFRSRVIRGHDYLEIIQVAEEGHFDLIVLGIHRHHTRSAFLGTTSERVVRLGSCPVLVVKDAVVGPYRRVLIPVDLSIHSRTALEFAAHLVPQGELYLRHACHVPFRAFLGRGEQRQYLREADARFSELLERDIAHLSAKLGEAAPKIDFKSIEGDVRTVIHDQVKLLKPELVAIGTHGRTGLAREMLGSVAEDILADAPVDVVAVKAS